jgi:thiosulfate reductase cytochrome b subunit
MGLEEDARAVMIAKNGEHANHVQGRAEWLWYGPIGWLIGYGYEPWRAFHISPILVLIGWAVFLRGYDRGLITPTEGTEYAMVNDVALPISKDYPKFNALVYSLETFVPLVKLGIADRWEPNGKCDAFFVEKSFLMTGGCLRGYMWFHMIAGWVLTALWVGGITGLVKT